MDYRILIIPVVVVVGGIIFMIVMSIRGAKSVGKAQECMRRLALHEYPVLSNTEFSVINLLEDALNAQHIWVVVYDKGGMRLIPTKSNPFTQTMEKYEDDTPMFDWKKQLAANLFVGNKTEKNEYIPFSAITDAKIDEQGKKIILQIGTVKKSFKYQRKDCFGAPQEDTLNDFFQYLNANSTK